jgi:hypothetical protein
VAGPVDGQGDWALADAPDIASASGGRGGDIGSHFPRLWSVTTKVTTSRGALRTFTPQKRCCLRRPSARGSNKRGADVDDLPRAPPKPADVE